ncbi:unnamed protein product [Alopecurus aequalis]
MGHLLNIKPHLPAPPTSAGNLKVRASTEPVKAKHLFRAFVVRHTGRLVGALAGARSALRGLLLDAKAGLVATKLRRRSAKIRKKSKGPCCSGGDGSATPTQYLNLLPDGAVPSWSSPMESSRDEGGGAYYYDSSWNTVIPADQLPQMMGGSQYLVWPEEDGVEEEVAGCNDIDRLAERFIARCHERFMLEKQASFRRFQEMLARSF